jgi:hypothetical protein
MPLLTIDDLETDDALITQVANMLSGEDSFLSRYMKFLERDTGSANARAPGIHASEISGCERKIVYSLNGTPRKEQTRGFWKMKFNVGHAMHAMIQGHFHEMAKESGCAMLFDDEVKISPLLGGVSEKWNINSSCDGIITFQQPDANGVWHPIARIGLEIKTESPDGYEKLRAPKLGHIEQAHVYMKALDVPVFWFLYMNKGNQNMTDSAGPWMVKFDKNIWDNLEARFDSVYSHARNGTLPDRDEGIVCEFCAFSHACQPNYLKKKGQPSQPMIARPPLIMPQRRPVVSAASPVIIPAAALPQPPPAFKKVLTPADWTRKKV